MFSHPVPALLIIHPGINERLLTERWSASWTRHPDDALRNKSGVFLYRKSLTLETVPTAFLIHVSADQRYRLSVNGVSVSWGPARGDLLHWRYETIDLAPYLVPGENMLAAVVHFMGEGTAPLAQMTFEAAFLMQGNTEAEASVNTPEGWKVLRDTAYSFSNDSSDALYTYCVIGPGEIFDAAQHPWDWQSNGFDDSQWLTPVAFTRRAQPYGIADAESHWWLVPRSIPAMEETPVDFGRVVRATGVEAKEDWSASGQSLVVPAHTRAVLLFDHGTETCGFPELSVSAGAGATLRLAYAEALVLPDVPAWTNTKGNRHETDGRILRGYADEWRLDGGSEVRLLRPLWWRTFRYAELTVETGDKPITLHRLAAQYTGYPFSERARFDAPELSEAKELWDIGWRTARLCAHETYMDCPYYEQLQYVGDTRIQCLVSLYTSGDHRLFRNALSQIDNSRLSEGLTQSRYPARVPQVIAPFSLWYIGMIHDYWKHVPGDEAFLRGLLSGVRGVLQWYRDRLRPDGLLGPLQWWCFVDWCDEWTMGEPPGAHEGGSAIISLQYALALQEAGELFAALGDGKEGARLAREAQSVVKGVRKHCFARKTGRVADTPAQATFSQHAAILALLAGMFSHKEREKVMERTLSDASLTQTTFYGRFYLNRALVCAGKGDHWLETLGPWRAMRDKGLTTWAEKPEPTRSDCHAWSASPNYEFLATVLGIGSNEPGWESVRIAPCLGSLTQVSGTVPHPNGEISVAYTRDGKTLTAEITLPKNVGGVFLWGGEEVILDKKGKPQTIRLKRH